MGRRRRRAAGLNRVEREFLEESRTAFARANRRLRALLTAALALLAVALAAGAVALVARGSAKRQATAAIAQRLGAQALVEPQLDRALLLAREGVELDDTPRRGAISWPRSCAARRRSRSCTAAAPRSSTTRSAPTGGCSQSAATTAASPSSTRGRSGRSGRAFQSVGQLIYFGAIVRPVRALAFSPDGRTLAVGDSDGLHATLALVDTRTAQLGRRS